MLNKVFKYAKIQISEVISSPSCRARQTALIGFDRIDSVNKNIAAYMFSNKKELQQKFRNFLLSLKVPLGKNIVISGHGGTLTPSMVDNDEITPKKKRKFWEIFKSKPISEIGHVGESGFTIVQKIENKLIARHTFYNLKDFAEAAMSNLSK